eukprot:scaffold8065_cov267-Pinguiococcus_pyrenoidosus.AAC.11
MRHACDTRARAPQPPSRGSNRAIAQRCHGIRAAQRFQAGKDKTSHDKTRQDKTKQDQTKQDQMTTPRSPGLHTETASYVLVSSRKLGINRGWWRTAGAIQGFQTSPARTLLPKPPPGQASIVTCVRLGPLCCN